MLGPTDGDVEEREMFLYDLDKVVDRAGNGYRFCVGNSIKVDITGTFRVAGENDNRGMVVDFCSERGFVCVCNM